MQNNNHHKNIVDQTSEESMIASDPPQWTPVTGVQMNFPKSMHVEYNYEHFDANYYNFAHFGGPQKGEEAPPFLAKGLNGMQVTLSDFSGQYLLIETGSITDPDYLKNIRTMNSLAADFSNVKFAVLYVRETHPGGKFKAHTGLPEKTRNAGLLKKEYDEQRLILVDSIIGDIHRNYGAFPNMVYLIDGKGKVLYRSVRNDPKELAVVLSTLETSSAARSSQQDEVHEPAFNLNPGVFLRVLKTSGPLACWDFMKATPQLWQRQKKASHLNT